MKKKKQKHECPYDDFACRVYSFCNTKKCYERGEKLKQIGIKNEKKKKT